MNPSSGLSTHAGSTIAQLLPAFNFPKLDKDCNESASSPIDMSVGENSVLADEILSICKNGVQSSFATDHLAYPKSPLGDPELLEVLATFFDAYFRPNKKLASSHVAVAAGASACLNDLMYSICEPGDAVLVPGPYWSEYYPMERRKSKDEIKSGSLVLNLADGFDFHFNIRAQVTPITVSLPRLEDQFTAELISALDNAYKSTSQTVRAVVLTNPHNPLGQCYPKEVLEACVVFCARHNIHLISDEVYALSSFSSTDFPRGPIPFTSILSLDVAALGGDPSRVHMIWSISKDFGCNGLRLVSVVEYAHMKLVH